MKQVSHCHVIFLLKAPHILFLPMHLNVCTYACINIIVDIDYVAAQNNDPNDNNTDDSRTIVSIYWGPNMYQAVF